MFPGRPSLPMNASGPMELPGDELHDIPDPVPLLPSDNIPWWMWTILVTAIVGILAFVLYRFLRRDPLGSGDGSAHFSEAYQALEALASALTNLTLAEIATEASLVLRHYLAAIAGEPALYETHEEFLLREDALESLPYGARQRLTPVLDELAAAKYGPSEQNDTQGLHLVTSCLEVLRGLESTREREIA